MIKKALFQKIKQDNEVKDKKGDCNRKDKRKK